MIGSAAFIGRSTFIGIMAICLIAVASHGDKSGDSFLFDALATADEGQAISSKGLSKKTQIHEMSAPRVRQVKLARRKMDVNEELKCQAGRIISPAVTQYYIAFSFQGSGECWLTPEDAADLVKFHISYKDKKKSEAKEIASAEAEWECEAIDGKSLSCTYDFSRQRFLLKGKLSPTGTWSASLLDEGVFELLAETLKDVDALKAVKPTAQP